MTTTTTPLTTRLAHAGDTETLVDLVRAAHGEVASRFDLTFENCPKHPSNCTAEWIRGDLERGVRYFLCEVHGKTLGCVGLEHATAGVCYMERLSVLPQYQGRGVGVRLVSRFFGEAAALGVKEIGIGIIAEYAELKAWYRRLGFVEKETRSFPHLPFTVLLMASKVEVVEPAPFVLMPFAMGHYDEARALWQRCEGIGLSNADTPENMAAYFRRNPGLSFVALAGEEDVVGTVLAGHDGRRGYLHHLAVSPEYRRKGLGHRLADRCIMALKEAGLQKVHLHLFNHNREGLQFWKAMGWDHREDISVVSRFS